MHIGGRTGRRTYYRSHESRQWYLLFIYTLTLFSHHNTLHPHAPLANHLCVHQTDRLSVELELLIESGNPKEASYARKLAPIRKRVCKHCHPLPPTSCLPITQTLLVAGPRSFQIEVHQMFLILCQISRDARYEMRQIWDDLGMQDHC